MPTTTERRRLRRADDDQAGDEDLASPTGRRSCWFAGGHAASQGSAVLPARMRFSICRRYAPARSIGRMRVLIVEDEPYLAEAIRDGLRLEAIAADIAGDGDTALELLRINAYDIAVLDRDIPGPSGDEIAERIVASGSGMPILMLTAADRLDDKASGFELGADDYLTKPFELRELVLRLRALDRRRAHNRPPVREIAGLRLDPFRREVYRDGRYVALPGSSSPCSKSSSPPKAASSAPKSCWSGRGTRTPTRSPTPCASPSRPCASGSANPGSSPPWPASATASTPRPDAGREGGDRG